MLQHQESLLVSSWPGPLGQACNQPQLQVNTHLLQEATPKDRLPLPPDLSTGLSPAFPAFTHPGLPSKEITTPFSNYPGTPSPSSVSLIRTSVRPVLTLEQAGESPGGFVNTQAARPHHRVSASVGLRAAGRGVSPRTGSSNSSQVVPMLLAWEPHFENHRSLSPAQPPLYTLASACRRYAQRPTQPSSPPAGPQHSKESLC